MRIYGCVVCLSVAIWLCSNHNTLSVLKWVTRQRHMMCLSIHSAKANCVTSIEWVKNEKIHVQSSVGSVFCCVWCVLECDVRHRNIHTE